MIELFKSFEDYAKSVDKYRGFNFKAQFFQ